MDDRKLDSLLRDLRGSSQDPSDNFLDSVMDKIAPSESLPAFWLAGTALAGLVALVAAVAIGFGTARSDASKPPKLALFSANPALFQSDR